VSIPVTSRLKALAARLLPRGMAHLAGANLLSQIATLLAMPVVARLVGAHELGLFQAYLTITIFAGVVACLRFEYAVLQPDDAATAARLTLVAVGCALVIGMATAVAVPAAAAAFETAAWVELSPLAPAIGAAVAISGLSSAITQWMVRHGNFAGLSRARWVQGISTAILQLGAAFAGWGGTGLIVSDIAGRLAGTTVLIWSGQSHHPLPRTILSPGALGRTAKEYIRFPVVSGASSLINGIGFSLPAFMIERYFGLGALGIYSLVERIMGIPTTLIGAPLAQTFGYRFKLAMQDGPVQAANEVRATVRLTFWLGLPAFGTLACFGGSLFILAFGESWRDAGMLAQLLTLPYAIAYSVWPVMVALTILNRLRLQLVWEISRSLAMLALLGLASSGAASFPVVMSCAVVLIAAFGCWHYWLCLRSAGGRP
jgi:O-antigen/teichoic acid export membrane protein